jgi:hypothetical protein
MRGSVAATLATAAFSAIVALLLVLPGQLIGPDARARPLAAPDIGSAIRAIEARLPEAVEPRSGAVAAPAQDAITRPRQRLSPTVVVRAHAAPAKRAAGDRQAAPTVNAQPIPVVAPAPPSAPPAVTPGLDGATVAPSVTAAAPLPVAPVTSFPLPRPAAVASPIAMAVAVAHAALRARPVRVSAIRDVVVAAQAECVDATCDEAPRAEGRPDRDRADGLRPVAAIAGEAAAAAAGSGQEARDADRDDSREARGVAASQAHEVAHALGG